MPQIESLFAPNRVFILDKQSLCFTCVETLFYTTCYPLLQYILSQLEVM